MSWQVQAAVGRKSTYIADGTGRLLYRLAEYATEDGIIDPAPNQDTMADWYGVAPRTIRNWLNSLMKSGELVQLRIGKGPGQTSAYRIPLTLTPEELNQSPKQESKKRIEENAAAVEARLIQRIEETFAGFVSSIEARLSAIENSLEEYRKEAETNTPFVSGIMMRFDALEKQIEEKEERNRGNATRSNGHAIYNDLNNGNITRPPYPPNGNGAGKNRNGHDGESADNEALNLYWNDMLTLCDGEGEKAKTLILVADDLARELLWTKPIPDASMSKYKRSDALADWWRPLAQVLQKCEWQAEPAREAFINAAEAMRGRNMSPSRPLAVMGDIGKLLSGNGNGNGSTPVDPTWPTQGGRW